MTKKQAEAQMKKKLVAARDRLNRAIGILESGTAAGDGNYAPLISDIDDSNQFSSAARLLAQNVR